MNFDHIIAVRRGKSIYRDGDTAIKVFDESYSKSDILNEALNQSRIEETGLFIPKILEVGTVNGKWAIVLEYIEGKTLASLMEEHPENMEEYLDLFVSIQKKIHALKAPLLTTIKDKMTRKISYSQLDATVRYDLQLKLRDMGGISNVCHCDFMPTNIIITPDGSACVLDWSHATQGNTCVDAAITYVSFKLNGQHEMADRYLDLFCQKSNVDKKLVLKWMPVAAASKSVKAEGDKKAYLLELAKSVEYDEAKA